MLLLICCKKCVMIFEYDIIGSIQYSIHGLGKDTQP